MSDVVSGTLKTEVRNGSTVVKVGGTSGRPPPAPRPQARRRDQYVELANEHTDQLFVLLAEFGNQRHPNYPDQDTDPGTPGPVTFDGPLHNEIPEPDRTVTTPPSGSPTTARSYYQDLYFGARRVPEDLLREAVLRPLQRRRRGHRLGEGPLQRGALRPQRRLSRAPTSSATTPGTLVRDGMNQWVADQKAAGRTDAQIKAELATFDIWDRYDFDGDGNFNEPDGYIDHFQIVHAGGDQADGDPIQGEDAIWSHRWYAYVSDAGSPARPATRSAARRSATPASGPATTPPARERRPVHGRPRVRPRPRPARPLRHRRRRQRRRVVDADGAEPPPRQGEQIGTRAGDLGAWDKLQLGWLDYETVVAGQTRRSTSARTSTTRPRPRASSCVLPEKQVTAELGHPFAGDGCSGRATATTSTLDDPAGRPHRHDHAASTSRPATTSRPTTTTCTSRRPPTAAHWTASTARSTASRSCRRQREPGHRRLSTRLARRPRAARRLRRRDRAAAAPLRHRRWRGAGRLLRRRHRGHRTAPRCSTTAPRPATTAGRSTGSRRPPARSRRLTTTTTSRAPRFVSYDKYLETGPYNFGFANTSRTSWSTSPTRRAC